MALFRKLFYKKPPDGLLEICERVYVFDSCFTTDAMEQQDYKGYVGGIITQLKDHYPEASILVFNFREGETQSQISNALANYDMTIMEYPRQYEGCPLLPMEVIHHFLRSGESWLSLGLQNVLLMHCERGGWAVMAFMLAALLIYRKHYTGEFRTLDMVYKQAPRELLHLLSPLNPIPSQLRYLQYVSRRNVATEWPPLARALTMDCVIIRMIPNFDGQGGCRPIFRIYGQDPFLVSDLKPKVLFSTPKKSRIVRHYKQVESELVKLDINCRIQGDVVLECINLRDDMEQEEVMFRAMFNTAFIRSNILMLNRDEIDILWDAKDLFSKDFWVEVIFSEMDTAASIVPVDSSCFEEKDGLPVEAFAKVQEIFSSVDWLLPKGDNAAEVLQYLNVSNRTIEAYSHAVKPQVNQSLAALEHGAKNPTGLTSENQSNISPKSSPNADVAAKHADTLHAPSGIGVIISTEQSLVSPGDHAPSSVVLPLHQVSVSKSVSLSSTPQTGPDTQQIDMIKEGSPLTEAETSYSNAPSTPPSQSKKVAHGGPGQPLFSSLTPPLEDKLNVQDGDLSTPICPSNKASLSIPTLKDDTTTIPLKSSSSAQSPQVHYKIIKDGPPRSEPSHSTASLLEDVVEATNISTPPSLPLLPPTNNFSSVMDVEKSTTFKSSTSRTSQSSALKSVQTIGGKLPAPPPPDLASPRTGDITVKTAPSPPPPPPVLHSASLEKSSTSTCVSTVPAPPPLVSPLKENLACGVGSPPMPPTEQPLTDSLARRHLACGVGSPPMPPTEQPLTDNLARRPAPSPPPPPPPPPPPVMPSEESSSVRRQFSPPPPPPPPLSPLKEQSDSIVPPPPLTPPIRDKSVTKRAPCPPPPPPLSPKERSTGGGPPSLQSAQSKAPPPPPPVGSSPSVPSAPPPPFHTNREISSLSTSTGGGSFPGSPSPPPPSIPPPGSIGKKSLLSRTVTSRNNQAKKLKPLHWLKLSRAVSGSLWAETQKSGEGSKAPDIDISELESLFSAAVPNSDQGGSGRKTGSRASMGNKPEKVQLIDHRRAYNCEIMLSKVKIPLHDLLSSVLALEDSALDVDQVDNLIKFCPTKEEMEVLKGYKGEKDKLGKCEQFFMELMQVPRIESKLRVFSFKIQFCSQVSDLRNSLNVVNSAADQIRGSAKLKRVMQTILSLGNALNQGTARGSAIGFRLDSLLKLTETRARNNRMTLMHYLCKMLSDKLPELLDFWQDLSSLEPASKIQLKYLAEEMQAINKGLEKVVQELAMSENDGPVSDQFRKALKEFLCFSEGEVRSLASLYSTVGRNVDALILYFGEDPARCPFEQVISTLLNFVRMFKKSHEENCKQLEFDKKKAEKEASEKLKAEKEVSEKLKKNVSDTGHLLHSPVRSVK